MANASFSNCPKVSVIVPFDMPRSCRGTLLRTSALTNNVPGVPDTNGRKYFSRKTGNILVSFFPYIYIYLEPLSLAFLRSSLSTLSTLARYEDPTCVRGGYIYI